MSDALLSIGPRRPLRVGREVEGFVHSVETGGTVDGPGVRFVVFTAGCPLACQYCHNPDCMTMSAGRKRMAGEMLDEIATYTRFLKRAGGGLTLSGGEPLMQPDFAASILRGAREMGLHTALDTSGFLGARATDALLEDTDLVLLDIKSWDRATYRAVTGVPLQPTLVFAERLAALGKPTWLRFVLVPGLTDAPANVDGLASYAAGLRNVERVEVLPFHKMGEFKWRQLGLPYRLGNTPEPTAEQVEEARERFRRHGLPVV
jgi:pyruvate formate lyase activating enzyme